MHPGTPPFEVEHNRPLLKNLQNPQTSVRKRLTVKNEILTKLFQICRSGHYLTIQIAFEFGRRKFLKWIKTILISQCVTNLRGRKSPPFNYYFDISL